MGGLAASGTAFVAFTKGHPVPTTTRFWVSALGHLGGIAARGTVAQDDGLMFSGLEEGPEGMYAIAFGSGRGRLVLARVREAGDFSSALLLRPVTIRVPLGRCCGGC
jgi:hypothetical protein